MTHQARPAYSSSRRDAGLEHGPYVERVMALPVLSETEEHDLARRWYGSGDRKALDLLISSHLRLVPTIAKKYAGYGIPIADLIGEGNIGLMQSAARFDPDKGFRFSTYARWWIKAAILNFILQSWSLVKVGQGAAKKRMFFNLRRAKRMLMGGESQLDNRAIAILAKRFGTSHEDVVAMDQRMSATDVSMHQPLPGSDGMTFGDVIPDETPNAEENLVVSDERQWRRMLLQEALGTLDKREQEIVRRRYLTEQPATLSKLASAYGLTAERVRQIEAKAIIKIRGYLKPHRAELAFGI